MARTDIQVNIRIPEGLLDLLRKKAKAADRSLTAEIVQRLESTLEADPLADLIAARRAECVMLDSKRDHVNWEIDLAQNLGTPDDVDRLLELRDRLNVAFDFAWRHLGDLMETKEKLDEEDIQF